MKRQLRRSIALIGMMGAGKSAVGRCLGELTNAPQFDTDELVAARVGMSIADIFSKIGETGFRDAETEALREIALDQPAIVITGGGIVLRAENLDVLKRLGLIVWLDADEETMFKRASQTSNRPLLQTENPRKRFAELSQARRPLYAKIADIRIDCSGLTDREVAEMILGNE